jgi:polyisoprenoid-binding protein YceI
MRHIMTTPFVRPVLACALLAGFIFVAIPVAAQDASAPLVMTAARVSIAGTSNIHDFTASTTDVKLASLVLSDAVAGPNLLNAALNPGSLQAFEIVVKAGTLTSPKEGLDKNMWKALKTTTYPDIVFKLTKLDGKPGALRAVGVLKIAGVEKDVAFDLKAAANASTITVIGDVPLLMTDYGIAPPKALMGMLKTDPKITVTFEVVLVAPQTLTR